MLQILGSVTRELSKMGREEHILTCGVVLGQWSEEAGLAAPAAHVWGWVLHIPAAESLRQSAGDA